MSATTLDLYPEHPSLRSLASWPIAPTLLAPTLTDTSMDDNDSQARQRTRMKRLKSQTVLRRLAHCNVEDLYRDLSISSAAVEAWDPTSEQNTPQPQEDEALLVRQAQHIPLRRLVPGLLQAGTVNNALNALSLLKTSLEDAEQRLQWLHYTVQFLQRYHRAILGHTETRLAILETLVHIPMEDADKCDILLPCLDSDETDPEILLSLLDVVKGFYSDALKANVMMAIIDSDGGHLPTVRVKMLEVVGTITHELTRAALLQAVWPQDYQQASGAEWPIPSIYKELAESLSEENPVKAACLNRLQSTLRVGKWFIPEPFFRSNEQMVFGLDDVAVRN
ncbi:MAG: hypothetical protein SFZ03_08815 [Candidatus Melainabacteria bacterium]|nr:hypothetical protein [Candidatus Melainabacteria bacterium]